MCACLWDGGWQSRFSVEACGWRMDAARGNELQGRPAGVLRPLPHGEEQHGNHGGRGLQEAEARRKVSGGRRRAGAGTTPVPVPHGGGRLAAMRLARDGGGSGSARGAGHCAAGTGSGARA